MAIVLVLLEAGGVRASIPSLVVGASLFSKIVLALLVVLSVYSWAVIWNRMRLYSRVEAADGRLLAAFRRLKPGAECRVLCEQHPHSLLAHVALAGQRWLDQHPMVGDERPNERFESAQRAMDRSANEEVGVLERHVGFLATVGSVSPFIGLMGTVWGVMSAFLNIGSQGSASLVVVAPGIAEALIATVAGLAAAIPAVVSYNHLTGRLREFGNSTGRFATEFLDHRFGGPSR
jgi:biopolymer transport protein TolQ